MDAGGMDVEFERRALEMGVALKDYEGQGQLLDTDMFRVVAEKQVQEAGIILLLYCLIVDVDEFLAYVTANPSRLGD